MKKFFKILMVLALLSGAALSCTKDYSKEIADVQKQNQDLQALVASLQNALNSTNATVSQLSSTSDKQAADIAALASANAEAFATIVADHADDVAYLEGLIADLKAAGASELAAAVEGLKASIKAGDDKAAAAAEKLESEIKACDEKAAKALADAVTTCKEDIAKLKEALEGKITDLETALTAALEAKAGALAEEIEKVDGKATANAAAIVEIDKTLEGIAATLEAYGKDIQKNADAIEANKTAIAAAQADLAKIKEQITSLSARLTNIVAAPAKDVEIKGVTLEDTDIERSIINMNFVVAPASAAEAIAAGNADVKLVLTNGISRKNEKPAVLNYTVTPDKVTAGEKGVINVYAVEDTIFDINQYGDNQKIYATLIVSGTDKAGDFERISEPVAVITGDEITIREWDFVWYKGDEAVKRTEGWVNIWDNSVDHSADSVAAYYGQQLTIVAADKDWTTLPCTQSDILKDYVLKTKVLGEKAYTIQELAELLEIEEDVTPHFTAEDKKTVDSNMYLREWDWDYTYTFDGIEKVIEVTADSTSTKLDVKMELPKEDPEVAVGVMTEIYTKPIEFGKLLTTSCSVRFVQRIGKHVKAEKAAETQTLEFGVNDFTYDKGLKTAFTKDLSIKAIEWLTTTQVSNTGWDCTVLEDGETVEGAYAMINPYTNSSKFVSLTNIHVPYSDVEKNYRLVLSYDNLVNSYGVVVVEYGDYIDLTVAPYHAPVNIKYTDEAFYLSRKTGKATIKTDATVKKIFSDIDEWVIGKAETPEDSAKVYYWFDINKFTSFEQTVSQGKNTGGDVGEATLKFVEDTLCVEFVKGTKFVEGEPVTVTLKDSINDVIKFNYTIIINTVKPGVKIATIPGFVNDENKVEVAGKIVADKYVINDINLSQYYKVENLTAKAEEDVVKVTFGVDKKVEGLDIPDEVSVSEKGTLNADAKIKWNDFKNTQFVLTAYANVHDGKTDSVKVTYWTSDPIKKIDPVALTVTTGGKDTPVKLFDTLKKELKIFSILDSKNIYPDRLGVFGGVIKIKEMKDWGCKVGTNDNYPLEQMKQLFTLNGNELTIKAHDAVGEIVLTIPCEFTYDLGKKEFNVVITID